MRIIGGAQRGRRLLPPQDRSVRPALDRIRGAIFQVIGDRVERARVLDLFAGVGAFGLEALSRGARRAHFVEASRRTAGILRDNLRCLGLEAFATVECADALSTPSFFDERAFLDERAPAYDLVFVDPPFPFFRDASCGKPVYDRVARIAALCPRALVVLRRPSSCRDPVPDGTLDVRDYGESSVLFLGVRDDAGDSSDAGELAAGDVAPSSADDIGTARRFGEG